MANPEQWVNLPSDELHKTDGITTLARLGPVRIRYKTKKAALSAFKVKIEPDGGDATYTDDEKNRNPGFRLEVSTPGHNAGTKKGKLLKCLKLPAAGGNTYKIKALYRKKEVSGSVTVESRRRLYFQVMAMQGVTAPDLTNLVDTFWGEADKLYIDLKQIGGTAQVPKIGAMNGTKGNDFIDSCKPAYTLKKYYPQAFAVCFIEHYANIATHPLRTTLSMTLPRKLSTVSFDGITITLTLPQGMMFWYDLDEDDDANHEWAGDGAELMLVDAAGAEIKDISDEIDDYEIFRDGTAAATYGGNYNAIRLKLAPDAVTRNYFTAKSVNIRVVWNVKVVDFFVNGVSYNDTNLVAVASRAEWEDRTVAGMEQTIIHEVGHKIGMVPKGTGAALTPHAKQYTQRTHTGSHCGQGATWNGTSWSGSPICVMFGSNWASRLGKFCPLCSPLARKLDLSSDMLKTTGFQNSL